jgi:conjugal transfer pilus assembly protein TraA
MTRDTFLVMAAVLALALLLTGCATTRPVEPVAAARSDQKADAQEAPAIAGTRVVATGPVLPRPEGPVPLRAPAQVMRVWIAPWEDSRGDLHAPGYLYTEIEPRRWTLGAPAEPDREFLIRPLQIERRDAKPDPARSRAGYPARAGQGQDARGRVKPARELTTRAGARGRGLSPEERASLSTLLTGEPMKRITPPTLLGVAGFALAGLLLAAPETVLAGAGGAEFQGAYTMLTGWMTGILGRIIAITFIVVGLVAGVMRQSIMGFVVGIAAGLGVFVAPDIIDNIVTATLPVL